MKVHPLFVSSKSKAQPSTTQPALVSSDLLAPSKTFKTPEPPTVECQPTSENPLFCAMNGCTHTATVTMTSEWLPGQELKVCESCQWTVDPAGSFGKHFQFSTRDEKLTKHHNGVLREKTTHHLDNVPVIFEEEKGEKKVGSDPSFPCFVKVLSLRKLHSKRRVQRCRNCPLQACALWKDASRKNHHFVCIDCQESIFGGWPAPTGLLGKAYLTEALAQAMIQKCSLQKEPRMPPFYFKP